MRNDEDSSRRGRPLQPRDLQFGQAVEKDRIDGQPLHEHPKRLCLIRDQSQIVVQSPYDQCCIEKRNVEPLGWCINESKWNQGCRSIRFERCSLRQGRPRRLGLRGSRAMIILLLPCCGGRWIGRTKTGSAVHGMLRVL